MTIKEILRVYNISHRMSASITPLTEIQKRGMILNINEPLELESRIEKYDALFSTGLSKEYVERREFNLFISLRELIQNALDEEELVSGQANVQVEQDSLGTWIMDNGRGLQLEALRMGESNKECCLLYGYRTAPESTKKLIRFRL